MIRTLPGARWDCRQCGACCRGFRFGPLPEGYVEGLEAAGVASWPEAAGGWYEEAPGPGGTTARFLRNRDDGACVFLLPDQRCAVHAALGEAAKPPFCREFPLLPVQTRTHLAVIARPECAGLHHSFEDGEPLAPQAEALPALPRIAPVAAHTADTVVLFSGVGISAESWATLEPILLDQTADKDPWQAAATIRRILSQATRRDLPPPPFPYHDVLWRTLFQRLLPPIEHLLEHQSRGSPGHTLAQWQRAQLSRGFQWCEQASAHGPARPLSPEASRYATHLLRGLIFSRRFAAFPTLTEGIGAFLLSLILAQRAAGLADPSGGQGPVSAAELAAIHTPWIRLIAHPLLHETLLREHKVLHMLFCSTQLSPPGDTPA